MVKLNCLETIIPQELSAFVILSILRFKVKKGLINLKFTPEVVAAIRTLKDAAENDFEKVAITNLETELLHYTTEIWRDIVGYEGLYKISSCGRVKSFHNKSEKILAVHINKFNYSRILLSKNGNSKTYLVHRLVAIAFIPNPDNKPEVNHKNGNKSDNRVENLEWVTCSENTRHAFVTGLAKALRGTNNGATKLTSEQIAKIRASCIIGSKENGIRSLSKKFNVSEHTIYRIVHFETFKDCM